MNGENGNLYKIVGSAIGAVLVFLLTAAYEHLRALDSSRFTPHGMCLAWQPGIMWTKGGADQLIAISYYIISAEIVYIFLKTKRLPFLRYTPAGKVVVTWEALWFGAFILGCGATHQMDVITLWFHPYWLDAYIRVFTALASMGTVFVMMANMKANLGEPSMEDLINRIALLEGDRKP